MPIKSQKMRLLSKCDDTKVKGFLGCIEKDEVEMQGS
jgi:hypothetical protein